MLQVYEESPISAGAGAVTAAAMPTSAFAAGRCGKNYSAADVDEAMERLADLSDSARRLNRPQQADRFLLLAWLAFDSAIDLRPA